MSKPDPFIRGSDPEAPHLFPNRRFGGFGMSVQADRSGYACSPRERFDDIRRYETVEVRVFGPNGSLEVQRAGFPPEVRKLFPQGGGSQAYKVPRSALPLIEEQLRAMAAAPPSPEPSEGPKKAVELTDAGLREVLLKLNEAIRQETGEINPDLVLAVSDLVEAGRERGIDLDGCDAVEELTMSAVTPAP